MQSLVLWHRIQPGPRDGADDALALSRWTEHTAAELTRAGARVLLVVHGQVACLCPAAALDAGVAATLRLLDEAERSEPPFLVSFGAALGAVEASPVPTGAALDRAALLAHRARPGELVLDAPLAEVLGATHLFRRSVRAGAALAWHGESVDRTLPVRALCVTAAGRAGAPALPAALPEALGTLAALGTDQAAGWVVVRTPAGGGTEETLAALTRRLPSRFVLWVQAVPGALEPLGSLRLALLRRFGSVARLERSAPEALRAPLARIARGAALQRAEAIHTLGELLRAEAEATGEKPWLVLQPFTSVDPATREVVALAARRAGAPVLVVAGITPGATLPKGLAELVRADLQVPPLTEAEAREVAGATLGPGAGEDVVDHVTRVGGRTPLGLAEAARTLLGRGDLVHSDRGFSWRRPPRNLPTEVPVSALLADRLAGIDGVARQVLEALVVAPSGSSDALLWGVMQRDGVPAERAVEAVATLKEAAFLLESEPLQATSAALRAAVFGAMEPPRVAALQAHVAETLLALDPSAEFLAATRGFFLHESGAKMAGARCLIDAGLAASAAGFVRAAMRLAAAAVEYDPSPETRRAASAITETSKAAVLPTAARAAALPRPGAPAEATTPSRLPPPTPPATAPDGQDGPLDGALGAPPQGNLAGQAVAALLGGHAERADHVLDTAVAEGASPAVADRLRAMVQLARGDVPAATALLTRCVERTRAQDEARVPNGVARVVLLATLGAPLEAMRTGLHALGAARALGDRTGERAAMHAVALIFDRMGLGADAATIRAAAAEPPPSDAE